MANMSDRIQVIRSAPRARTFEIFLDGKNVGLFNKDDVAGVVADLTGQIEAEQVATDSVVEAAAHSSESTFGPDDEAEICAAFEEHESHMAKLYGEAADLQPAKPVKYHPVAIRHPRGTYFQLRNNRGEFLLRDGFPAAFATRSAAKNYAKANNA